MDGTGVGKMLAEGKAVGIMVGAAVGEGNGCCKGWETQPARSAKEAMASKYKMRIITLHS